MYIKDLNSILFKFSLGYYCCIEKIWGRLQSEHSSFANLLFSFVTVEDSWRTESNALLNSAGSGRHIYHGPTVGEFNTVGRKWIFFKALFTDITH